MGSAQKLGVSQPATSKALARLRTLFNDELLVKTSRGFVPTAKALALVEPIYKALRHVQSAQANEQALDPKTSDRVFRLRMDDYTESVFLPGLKQELEEIAPNVRIQVYSTDRQRLRVSACVAWCASSKARRSLAHSSELIALCRKSGNIIESANFGSFADRGLKSTSSRTIATFSFSRVKLAFPYKTTLGGTVRVRSL
jgi:DNA-binding transcriptional LysR family regulator